MNNHEEFFVALREKSQQSLPADFDANFWKKFDARFPAKKKKKIARWQWLSAPVLALSLLVLGFFIQKNWLPPAQVELVNINEAKEEEMDLATNMDALESVDVETEDFPATDEEWNQLLGGVQNGEG